MRIYYFVSEGTSQQGAKQQIYQSLAKRKVEVFSNAESFNTGKISHQEKRRLEETGEFLIGKMQAVIIEASEFSSEVGYVLALAMSRRVRVLYLHEKGSKTNPALAAILDASQAKKLVTVMPYDAGALPELVEGFVRKFDTAARREKPTLKFTLRITPRLARYLDWKSQKEGKSKADYLREDILEEIMDSDDSYQAHERQRSGGS